MASANPDFSQPDWWINFEVGPGPAFAITVDGAKDASVTRTAAGIYSVQLGSGGAVAGKCAVDVDFDINPTTPMAAPLVNEPPPPSQNFKNLVFFSAAGLATDPTRVSFRCRRLLG
jgi:hypothetical protein